MSSYQVTLLWGRCSLTITPTARRDRVRLVVVERGPHLPKGRTLVDTTFNRGSRDDLRSALASTPLKLESDEVTYVLNCTDDMVSKSKAHNVKTWTLPSCVTSQDLVSVLLQKGLAMEEVAEFIEVPVSNPMTSEALNESPDNRTRFEP